MSTPSFDDIKASTEKAVGFIDWLAEVLRGKNWVTKLLLLVVILFTIFNPLLFPQILKRLGIERELPFYAPIFWLVIGIIFIIALIVAIRTKPKKTEAPAIELGKRSPIKGLRPFGAEDAEIFAQLQREPSIRECLEAITTADCRFGVICGESGCGKSSFLQAGIIPRLKDQYQCVYVKFTDLDPLHSIRQALDEQAQLPETTAAGDDLLSLLQAFLQANSKPLALFFDQFEQFFVHRKLKEQREPFIRTLANWYKARPPLPVKIIVSIRGDFKYRLDELQKALGYSLGPQDSFTLAKFTPQEAAEIFHVIAETEGIACDADFVKEIAEQQLAHEDGLISPVDIQILAWMIRGQKTADERAFNRHAFQQLGGIEGLLERFLSRVLDVRETEERRQTALKVLLALTDLERNVRAGVLTLETLQQKLAGSVPESELMETVQWLARGDIRLITPSKLGKDEGFELAHERLIPALRKITGTVLSQVDQANQLLNRRVNEWLGNEKESHYLLRWNELRKITRQQKFLTWGENEQTKKELLAQSRRRQQMQFSAIGGLLILFLIFLIVRPTMLSKLEERERNQRVGELKNQFVSVAGDTFLMGDLWSESQEDTVTRDLWFGDPSSSEKPVHEVILSSFGISKYEITNQQYCDFLNSIDSAEIKVENWLDFSSSSCQIRPKDGKFVVLDDSKRNHPVVEVTWYGAVSFCNYLSKRFQYTPCYDTNNWSCDTTANGYRLPTEAEWEFAARAGGKEIKYPWGNNPPDSSKANYWISGKKSELKPVGMYPKNESGLYDMAGNAWEWCHDWYDANYYYNCYLRKSVKDPKGPSSSPLGVRVLRGGSWDFYEFSLRCSYRNYGTRIAASAILGFV